MDRLQDHRYPLDIDVSGRAIMDDLQFNKIASEVKGVLSIAV